MKLVTFEVSTAIGPFRRLGAVLDGHEDRIVDLTTAYATYLAAETDEPSPAGLSALRTPPDMIGWLSGGSQSREAAEQALAFVRRRGDTGGELRGPSGEQVVFARPSVRLLAPVPRPNSLRDFSIFHEHMSKAREIARPHP
ncbi:MAG: hypothetical protein J2O39_10635, partial [Acidimicrobiales bacterium]|nr:hypothetical protein [Acidimicrobiales bacterium]